MISNATTARLVALISLTFSSQAVFPQWTGGLEAGTQLGSGESPTLRFFASRQSQPLSHYLYLDWTQISGGSRYRLGYNPTFAISQSFYSFGRFSIEQDDPGAIEREINASVGLGNSFFRTRNSSLSLETGIGAQQLRFADNTDNTDGFVFIAGNFSSKQLNLVRLDVNADLRAGENQTSLDAEAGISVRIGPNTALKYAYRYQRFDLNDGRADVVDKDKFFTVTYGF